MTSFWPAAGSWSPAAAASSAGASSRGSSARGADDDLRAPQRATTTCATRDGDRRARSPTAGPELVIHLAAVVGGIGANRENPGRFFYENAIMGIQLIEQARARRRRRSSSRSARSAPTRSSRRCRSARTTSGTATRRRRTRRTAWPRRCCSSRARPTAQQYGFNVIYLIPVNLYGPGDNFDPASSHVIPALIKKCVEARDAGARPHRGLGHRLARRASSSTSTTPPRASCSPPSATTAPSRSTSASGSEITIRDLVELIAAADRLRGRDPLGRDEARRPAAPGARHEPRPRAFGFVAQTTFEDGLRATIEWSSGAATRRRSRRPSSPDRRHRAGGLTGTQPGAGSAARPPGATTVARAATTSGAS